MANKTVNEPQEETPQVAQTKTPEQIAAEIVGNGRKPVIITVLTVIILGVVLAVSARTRKAENAAIADQYEKLDAIVIGTNTGMELNDADALEEKLAKLEALISANKNAHAVMDAHFYKGKFQYDLGKYAEAVITFEEFYKKNPTRSPFAEYARLGAANAKMNMGTKEDLESALKLLDESVTTTSDTPLQDRIRYQMGLCNALLGDVEKARTILKELVDKKGEKGMASIMKGPADKLLGLMRLAKADDVRKLANEFPTSLVKVTPPKKIEPKKDDTK